VTASGGNHDNVRVPESSTPGTEFAHAFVTRDRARLTELLDPRIDFRGLTPNRTWEATDREALLEILLTRWLEDSDEVRGLEAVETDHFADRERVGYRFGVTNPDGDFLVEQQAYLAERDGRIGWMRVVCSGFRPVSP
jgi:hypothetical protein